jgi:hypothetical protein
LYIPEAIAKEYLIPKEFIKPTIEIGNYYLKWDDASYGVQLKEVPEIKEFIKKSIPIFDSSYELLNSIERSKDKQKEKHRFPKSLSPPQIHLAQRSKNHTIGYELYMKFDGSTFIYRIERIETIKIDNGNPINDQVCPDEDHTKSTVFIKWMLGELLFNRQDTRTKRQKIQ